MNSSDNVQQKVEIKTTDPEHDSFFSLLPELARDSVASEGSETEIDEFILTEMCKEVAAIFGGADYNSKSFDDYDNYTVNKDRVSSIGGKSVKSSVVIDFVRQSLAGVNIDGVPAIDRFSMSLENPEEQHKLLEYFKKAKMEKERQDREKAQQQEAARIKRQEQDKRERDDRGVKAKKEKEEKEIHEGHERERREHRERRKGKETEEKERMEREARERSEREANTKAEKKAKARAEQERQERERREVQEEEDITTDMIEVAPGLTLPVLSREATYRALARQKIITVTCFACQQTLTAPANVDFVVCCDDQICMAVEGDNKQQTNEKRCIGFGLKDGSIAEWIAARKSNIVT